MKKLLFVLAVVGAAILVACNGNKKANEEATNTEVADVQSNYETEVFTTKSGKKVTVYALMHASVRVAVDGKEIELSYKEFELLSYFFENKGVALSREKILNNVWNYDYFGDARTIDTHVKKLRGKLGDKGEMIKTIWGMGYKFDAE